MQKSPQDLNKLFDQVVLEDTLYPVEHLATSISKSNTGNDSPGKLNYNPKMPLWECKFNQKLDSRQYNEEEKIQFIKEVLSDTARDVLDHLNDTSCKFWRNSPKARLVMTAYFNRSQPSLTDPQTQKYQSLSFKTTQQFPEAHALITDYFNNRSNLSPLYSNEGDLVYRLIELGKDQEAVKYLELLIQDYLAGKVPTINLGSRITGRYDGYIFDLLCFSKDPAVAQKSKDLLFLLLQNKYILSYELYPLTIYLDLEAHKKLLRHWFEYFNNFDFQKLDKQKVNSAGWQYVQKEMPEIREYLLFMTANAQYLGEIDGRVFWKAYIDTRFIWESYKNEPFESSQLYILEQSLRDTTLLTHEKRAMLQQLFITDRLLKDGDSYGIYAYRLLRLIKEAYSDVAMTREEFNRFRLHEIPGVPFPLTIEPFLLKATPFNETLSKNSLDNIVADLNAFAVETGLSPISLSESQRFKVSLGSKHDLFYQFFKTNNRLAWFDPESSDVPSNYHAFYEEEFKSVFFESGIYNISVSAKVEQPQPNLYTYDVFVSNGKTNLKHHYSNHGTDWYNPARLVKMLNICLMESNSKWRLVGIDTRDQNVMYCLIEPEKLKKLLDKYNIGTWVFSWSDAFHLAVSDTKQ